MLQLYIFSVTEQNCSVMTPSQHKWENAIVFQPTLNFPCFQKYKYTAGNSGGETTPAFPAPLEDIKAQEYLKSSDLAKRLLPIPQHCSLVSYTYN